MIAKNNLLNVNLILSQLLEVKDLKVADLGCGNFGFFVFPLAHLVGKNGQVYAVDIMKGALDDIFRRARLENLPQVKTVWSDLEVFGATKIEAGQLDAAFLINTLHQAKNSLDMLKESVRMIKPGGKLIIVDWNDEHPFGPAKEQHIKEAKLKAAASKLSLELESEFNPGDSHYGLVFKKII
ncbi:MAG: class I SAM-dependent methyltransferase [Patescibacteria group bacterium]|jgi:ubiquinone/menaquinone biosynthesis C-methylase UbiE